MSKAHPPELKKFMDKKLSIKLNAGRCVTGVLRGFDPFMNLVLDESVEECKDGNRNPRKQHHHGRSLRQTLVPTIPPFNYKFEISSSVLVQQ
ncbi:Small nuclear ribonucleoprotein G [Operophtera brumata]|uniref:Small nuclear ribonucleoprotein G n=1 Tax=Operophtera brumata TaxID=104452 RepID=A0A0L7L418_OPEBR|nr:Small nuclear ribonucleoprotein G [Operophtera brumata]